MQKHELDERVSQREGLTGTGTGPGDRIEFPKQKARQRQNQSNGSRLYRVDSASRADHTEANHGSGPRLYSVDSGSAGKKLASFAQPSRDAASEVHYAIPARLGHNLI